MSFENVHKILLEELYKIGGELFSYAAIKKSTELKADNGDEESKKILQMNDFLEQMFNNKEPNSEKEKLFNEILTAIQILQKC